MRSPATETSRGAKVRPVAGRGPAMRTPDDTGPTEEHEIRRVAGPEGRGRTRRLLVSACAAAGTLLLGASPARAAGDVTAAFDPATGLLEVTGTSGDDDVTVASAGAADAFVVSGGSGTTVNGQPSETFAGVTKLTVRTGVGSDRIKLDRIRLRSKLSLHGGWGADTLILDGVTVGGNAKIHAGPGDDRVTVTGGSDFGRRLLVHTADGNDDISIFESRLDEGVYVDSGRGHDDVDVEDSSFGYHVEIRTKAGNDEVDVDDCEFRRRLEIHMSNGRDDLTIDDTDVEGDLELDGGDGDDDELDFRGHNDFDHDVDIEDFEY